MSTITPVSHNANAPASQEREDDFSASLRAASIQIARLETVVAELLLKNEELRQQISSRGGSRDTESGN
jgi:arginine deiminase